MKKKILIVEDNPRNMRLITMTLSGKDYELFEASNGEEALDLAMRQRPDLIIMDIQLPKVNGLITPLSLINSKTSSFDTFLIANN